MLRYLPTKDLCLQSVIYAKLMTDRKTNGLADFNTKFQHDPIALNSSELYVFNFLQYTQSSCVFSVSIRDDPYWISRKNSLELIELSSINKVSLV